MLVLPYCMSAATLLASLPLVLALWGSGIRAPPRLSAAGWCALIPIGVCHAIGHIAGTVGTTFGSVSFAQVVKAAGPVYACLLSALVLREQVSRRVWLSLLPIVGGVGLATLTEASFAWAALLGAVVSDLALAWRNVLSKQRMDQQKGLGEEERALMNMSPANMFGALTLIATAVTVPAAALIEGAAAPAAWAAGAAATPGGGRGLAGRVVATGLFFYGYSEVAMKALSNVGSVTHAIGNTMRRVVILLVSVAVFRTTVTPLGALGSACAISGAYMCAGHPPPL